MKFILSLLALGFISALSAQHAEHCKTMYVHQKLMEKDAAYRARVHDRTTSPVAISNTKTAQLVYKIPVVVHILHTGSAVGVNENISDEQIYSAIYSLNNSFRKRMGGNGGDANIEFCLAQKDPSGNPHSGINRVNASAVTNYTDLGATDGNEVALKAISKWDNSKYYNIWVVTEIDDNEGGGGTQGFAHFPGANASVDGTVILYNAIGYDPDGSKGYTLKTYTNKNVTLIHELGHAFELYHTFQGDGTGLTCPSDADCGNDGDCVSDTPVHKRSDSDCVGGTNECTGGSRDLFIHNYMDYSSEACANEFTAGQIVRMRASISSGDRMSLADPSNLIACGCDGNAAPITRFFADNQTPCVNVPVEFVDVSIDFPVSWTWTFEGGNPATSASQSPSVTYAGAGSYNVSLTTTSSGGQTHTVSKTNYIHPKAKVNTPISENFTTFVPSGWQVNNPDNDITWSTVNVTDPDGVNSNVAYLICYDYSQGNEKDDLILPLVNLEGVQNAFLSFYVAHDQFDTSIDSLQVLVSTDCGVSWTGVYKKGSPELQTSSTIGDGTHPNSSDQWRNEIISLALYAGQPLTIAFRVINGYGNNIYIDNIEVGGTGISAPLADFNASNLSPALNEAITFYDASYGTISSYSWDFGTGASLSSPTSGVGPHEVSYNTSGLKNVSLTVSGPGGNNTKTITSYINVSVLSTERQFMQESVQLYPNPANQSFYVKNIEQGNRVVVLNTLGEAVATLVADKSLLEVSTNDVAPGIYSVLIYKNGNVYREKIVVSR